MNIKKLNDKNFTLQESDSDQLHFDAWKIFDFPENLTEDERAFTVEFLDIIGIDIDDEYIINFNAKPNHLANVIVHILRLYKSYKS